MVEASSRVDPILQSLHEISNRNIKAYRSQKLKQVASESFKNDTSQLNSNLGGEGTSMNITHVLNSPRRDLSINHLVEKRYRDLRPVMQSLPSQMVGMRERQAQSIEHQRSHTDLI